MTEIRANSVLPANRTRIELTSSDGQVLVGELALPVDTKPRATLICVHPLPTHGGSMDSHLFRKFAWRLPALADYAVLRFNLRGTRSALGASTGAFDKGEAEGLDLKAALDWAHEQALPNVWLVGWSFGTDVIAKHAALDAAAGVVLISPPVRFTSEQELARWRDFAGPIVALVPEHDEYLPPAQARQVFDPLDNVEVVSGRGMGHLWVGEKAVRFVLARVVDTVTPGLFANVPGGFPEQWDGPMERWSDI